MARLPEPANPRATTRAGKIRHFLQKGYTTDEIAEKLAKGNERKKKIIRSQLRRMLVTDEETAQIKAAAAAGVLVDEIEDVAEAVMRRAKKGNIPAAKLAMEASGFHNPRVKHEHTGDIKVTIANVPRPPEVKDDEVVDAEVVED